MAIDDDQVLRLAGAKAFRWSDDAVFIPLGRDGDRDGMGVVVPLPSSVEAQPWIYAEPFDAADWLQMLRNFCDEELDTGARDWAVIVEERGVRCFLLAPYGFRRADPAEHARLMGATGPFGWYRDENGRLR